MPHQYPTHREILRANRALPEHLRQCTVVLQFRKPLLKPRTENFYRIRLTRSMFQAGEGEYYHPEILQPGRVGRQKCLGCGRLMKRTGALSTVCVNPLCSLAGRATINGPRRGVHSIRTEFESRHPDTGKPVAISFVVGKEWNTLPEVSWAAVGMNRLKKRGYAVEWERLPEAIERILGWPSGKVPVEQVSGCLLVLDRRYTEECLCAVYRTAGQICDQMGWRLK